MHEQDHERTTLANGLRILTGPMPWTRSVAVSIYVGAGSRYEAPEESGHVAPPRALLFKGTTKRPSAQQISEAIDGVGGVLNAGTDRELTVYYAKVAAPHFSLAADVLTDMLRDPLMAAEELEKERKVVIEELASIEDSPAQLVDVLLDATMWPDQPLGRDVAGTEESVTALTREGTIAYMRAAVRPEQHGDLRRRRRRARAGRRGSRRGARQLAARRRHRAGIPAVERAERAARRPCSSSAPSRRTSRWRCTRCRAGTRTASRST